MFTIHGFDPKPLTEKELFDRQLDLTRKRMIAERFGKVEVSEQISVMIQAIEFERRERLFSDFIGVHMKSSAGVVIETDDDLKAIDTKRQDIIDKKSEAKPETPAPSNRQVRRPIRTATPLKREI